MYHKMAVRTVPSPPPSIAGLKMVISTSTSRNTNTVTKEDEVADCVSIGTVQLVDAPKPVVAIRLQIEDSKEGALNDPEQGRDIFR